MALWGCVSLTTPLALELITAQGEGLAAPSANRFSCTSPSCAQHVREQFHDKVLVLNGGACRVGLESTVCEVRTETQEILIYRPGMIGPSSMASFLKEHEIEGYHLHYQSGPVSPGQLASHYRPQKPLVVYGKEVKQKDVFLAIKKRWPRSAPIKYSLSQDPYVAARTLYQILHDPKINAYDVIVLYAPMDLSHGGWVAIKDRLQKSASLFFD